jgi:hypothetical protein
MAEVHEELPEWIRLPIDLQHGFFKLAAEEAERLSEIIKSVDSSIMDLKAKLSPHIQPAPEQFRSSVIAAVDSSRSPRLSERLGIRYGVYATGVIYLRGFERREKFEPEIFRCRQALSQENSRYLFDLLTIQRERKMALEALKECDFLFLDGSFYGFVYPALRIKKGGSLEKRERDILSEIFNITEELRKSGKVLGVVKRSHSRAIGGYMLLQYANSGFINILDKHLLSLIMPGKSMFEYGSILGECNPAIYTRVAYLVSRNILADDLLSLAKDTIYEPFKKLSLPADGFAEMRRAQIKFYNSLPPCELEYPNKMNLKNVLLEKDLFSEVTNLPLALDLVDNLVNISSKFTEEFVSEIEGRVLEKIARNEESLESIKAFFAFLNPQKPF